MRNVQFICVLCVIWQVYADWDQKLGVDCQPEVKQYPQSKHVYQI